MCNKTLPNSLVEFGNEVTRRVVKGGNTHRICIELFELVRDIPYGNIGSRNPQDVFKQRMGTCSGKHALLKYLFQAARVEVSDIIVMHAFNDLPVSFPDHIFKLFDSGDILDPHNIIRIRSEGEWQIVDATWDSPLERFGFPVTRDWDGKSKMELCVVGRDTYEVSDPIVAKKEMINDLPKEMQRRRKLFLKSLTEWLAEVR